MLDALDQRQEGRLAVCEGMDGGREFIAGKDGTLPDREGLSGLERPGTA